MSGAKGAARLALLQLAGRVLARRERRSGGAASPPAGAGPPRILLIRPDHLGDTLLATPAAHLLRSALPDAEIEWLVGPWAAEMAARAGGPGEVHALEFPGFTRRPKSSPIQPYRLLAQEAARLRARHYDAALILRPDHWWGAMLAAAAGIPRRFGCAVAECRPFLTDMLPPPTGHAVETNQELARLAAAAFGGGPVAGTLSPSFPVTPEDAAWASRLPPTPQPPPPHAGEGETVRRREPHLSRARTGRSEPEVTPPLPRTGDDVGAADIRAAQRAGGRGLLAYPRIAVHPGSGATIKSWPVSRWAAVVRELRERHGAEVVLTGGPGERDLLQQIAAQLEPAPLTLAGETTLGQLAALFAVCELVIGGDSGPLHLAAAVGTRTVRLYGPSDTVEFGPWPRDDGQIALTASLPCQPCRNLIAPPCGAVELPACLRDITVDAVVRAVESLLRHREAPHPPAPSLTNDGASPFGPPRVARGRGGAIECNENGAC